MNAEDNKKLMQDIFAGVAVGDGRLFAQHLADDVTLKVTGRYTRSRTIRGQESVMRDLYGYLRTQVEVVGRMMPTHFIAEDDHVVVEGVGTMVTKAGVPYENEYCLVYRLKNGQIVEMREYQDSALCERVLGPYPAAEAA